jgi:hypothetical protein
LTVDKRASLFCQDINVEDEKRHKLECLANYDIWRLRCRVCIDRKKVRVLHYTELEMLIVTNTLAYWSQS